MKSLKNHALTVTLKRMQELLEHEAFQAPSIAADETAQFHREKIQNVIKSLSSLVNQTPLTLVSEVALNQMNTNFQAPINELTAFASNRNAGHLANAVAQIDQNILNYTWAFLPKINPLSAREVGEVIDSLQERTRQTIEQLVDEKENLSAAIVKVSSELKEKSEALSELSDSHIRLKADMETSLSNLETTFNKAQLDRDNEFDGFMGEAMKRSFDAQGEFEKKASSFIDVLERYKDDAARIVQVVGDIGVTGSYQNIANKETEQADRWRLITVGLFACGLVMAGVTFFKFYHEPVTGTNTIAIAVRLLYALAIAAPAFYTARESARHRTNADRARQTELELASLGPFIELMKDQDKEEIRKSLVSKYFGRSVEAHEIKPMINLSEKREE